MADRLFHLWREFPTPPYQRWACDVTHDVTTPDGFRIMANDPAVADPGFLHDLTVHLQEPHLVHQPQDEEEDAIVEVVKHAVPGEPGHFQEAIRTVPGATIRPFGRR